MAKAIIGAALIATAVVLDVATVGLATPFAAYIIGAEIGMFMAGASMELSSIADALTNTVTLPQTVRSPAAPWQVIYGNVRCGGTQIDLNSYGDNFKYCDMVVALACHPCVGVQQHTEVIPGDATFPSFGGLYINGQGMQWRNNAEGGSGVPHSAGYDINGTPFGYTTSNKIQDLNQNHYSTGTHVYMECYNGTGKSYQNGSLVSNQVSQFYISKGPAGHWDSACTMMIDPTGAHSADGQPKGFTYVYLRLLYASNLWAGGLPSSIRFDVRGKSDIWDPRLSGGAGGYAYTNNAALVIADFMTNPYFGMGYKMADFNTAALIAAANICDTAVPLAAGGTIAQYSINGTFTTNENPANVLKTMLDACGGDISYVGGEWFIFPGTYVYPTATIDNTMMLGPIQVKTGKKGRDLINAVKGSFVCPAANDTLGSPNIFLNEQPSIFNGQWQKQAFPPYAMDPQHGYSSDVWLALDGQKLYKELNLPFTTSAATCQRLAKQALLKNRIGNGLENSLNQGASFTVECNMRAYDIVPHDTVWVNYPRFNWTAPPSGFGVPVTTLPSYTYTEFEVTDAKLTLKEEDGKPPVPVYELTLRATSPDIYLWNGSDELTMTDNKYPQFANTMQVAGPTSLTAVSNEFSAVVNPDGTQSDGILASWTKPADGYVLNGGRLIVQIMPVVAPGATYSCTASYPDIVIDGTSNPFAAEESIFLAGAGPGGQPYTATIFSVSGQTCTLTTAPVTSVSHGNILAAGWQTVAQLAGTSNQYLIVGLVDGAEYYVQVYAQNSAGITSVHQVAGPVTVTNGSGTPGLLPYRIHPVIIKTAINANGWVENVGGTASATVLGNIDSATANAATAQSPVAGSVVVSNSLSNGGALSRFAQGQNVGLPGSVEFDVYANGGIVDVLLYASAGSTGPNGYFLRFDARSGFLPGDILLVTNGTWTGVSTAVGPLNAAALSGWHSVRAVAASGGSYAIYVDGVLLATLQNNAFTPSGATYYGAEVVSGSTLAYPGWNSKTLGTLPDGTGRYAAVETGADHTLNHILTTVGDYDVIVNFTAVEMTETPLAWTVISNGSSDSFNVNAVVSFVASATHYQDIQMMCLVDGVVASQFGCGFQQANVTDLVHYSGSFFGSVTGLAAGSHTIRLYFTDANNRGYPPTETVYSAWGTIQQISS